VAIRQEGQIWISPNDPQTLKYYAREREHWVVTTSAFVADPTIKKGMLVATDPTYTYEVVPAQWPRDVDRIVGIALTTFGEQGAAVQVARSGYVVFNRAELEATFASKSDLTITAALSGTSYYSNFGNMTTEVGGGNGWSDVSPSKFGRGANIYWFSGRTLKTGASSYSHIEPTNYKGKLTIATPVGYLGPAMNQIPWADDSLNIKHKNLPIIGNVADYTYDGSGNITSLTLQVNFSQFSNKIRFEYPITGVKIYDEVNDPQTIPLRHGLFPAGSAPFPAISMLGYANGTLGDVINEAFTAQPGFDSIYTGDKRTEVEIASDTSFYYKIQGEVNHN
jgi:hypothetical protein